MTTRRNMWEYEETKAMLTILEELTHSENKAYKNLEIYTKIEAEMRKKGFVTKDYRQIETRWKNLKKNYYRTKKLNRTNDHEQELCYFFEELDRMIGCLPLTGYGKRSGIRDKGQKASDEQRDFLLTYMESNVEFANDSFDTADEAHNKFQKWRELADMLNGIGGATKDGTRWRKFWIDQKLRAKEREAMLNTYKKIGSCEAIEQRELTDFEKRTLNLIKPVENGTSIKIVNDLFLYNDGAVRCLDPLTVEEWIQEEPTDSSKETKESTNTSATTQDKLLQIEEVKLVYLKKEYELKRQKFEADELFRKEYIALRKSEIEIERRKLELRERELK